MSAYDLILQGGTLYDPCAGTMELCDLAIKDGKIAARGKNLNAADAETVMDVTGLIVSPGLIDMHCHVYPVFPYQMPDSLRTINAEEYMFRAGVTTAVDAGTTGWRNFGDFKENVIDATKVRVLAFIDMAAKGMHYPPSEQAVADINPEITAAVANTWSDVIVGVKSAHYWAKHEDADHPIWASIDGAIKAASMSGKIVMVDSIPIVPERSYPDILAHLRPGDVHTHVFAQQFPLMNENGRMQPYMLAERERGVHFDVGHGSGSFWFRQAVGCFNQGLHPRQTPSVGGPQRRQRSIHSFFPTIKPESCGPRMVLPPLKITRSAPMPVNFQRFSAGGFWAAASTITGTPWRWATSTIVSSGREASRPKKMT